MNTIKIVKYEINEMKSALLVYYLIIIAIATLLTLATAQHHGNVSIGGLDFASVIFIFVSGISIFKQSYIFMQANNITRKRYFQGHILSIFPVTAFIAAFDIIINRVTNIFGVYNSLFSQIYLRTVSFVGANPNIMDNFIWSFSALSLFAIIGYFVALVYYRSNTLTKIVVSVSPFILLSVLGYLNRITNGTISYVITDFFALIWGFKHGYNPYIAVLSMSIGFIIFSALSFLLIRKAPVK